MTIDWDQAVRNLNDMGSEKRRIVVGVDGSEGSVHAIDWAIQAAKLISALVELVYAIQISYETRSVGMVGAVRRSGQQILDGALQEANLIGPSLPMLCQLVKSKAGAALLRASEGAESLAIGARGRGGFNGLGPGHVGEQFANNAQCTVVIVRCEHNPLRRRRIASTAVNDAGV